MAGLILCLWRGPVEAARSYTITQTPALGTQLVMGSTVSFTYRITNTNTGSNTGERIYEMRFRLPGTGTIFSSTTAAPAGWTRTAYSTTSVTFRATSWANAIATGTFKDFTIIMVMRTTSANVNETLRDIRARYTTTTTGPPFSRLSSLTTNNPGSWALRALAATIQITDTSNNPISSVQSGGSFKVIITVTNRSSSTQSSIVVGNGGNRPVATVGAPPAGPAPYPKVTLNSPTPVYSPNPLTLAPGATGTITFTYTTSAAAPNPDSGTVTFSFYVRNSTGSATSINPITSGSLNVNTPSASLSVNPLCVYLGQNFTVTMTLTNSAPNAIINVTPTLTPSVGAPIVLDAGTVPNPNPAPPNGPIPASNSGTFLFTWVYQVNGGTAGDTFGFTGSASGTEQGTGTPRSTLTTTSPTVTRAGFTTTIDPPSTNASSTNQELTWSFTNQGCNEVKAVSLSIPPGWLWGGDAYSLVEKAAGTFVETWTVSGTNPVVFNAPVGDEMIIGGSGEFRLVFTAVPSAPETSTFTRIITDINNASATLNMPFTVDPFNTGGLNQADTESYREDFR
ncbi:MAG: hypothetical protein EPO39_05845 [Candidatus Manganitrophaceae bacterium]|nr:MAG: hypothetical protein EPO39_05845 [Candidatus Manganitrophaceae bacterium]